MATADKMSLKNKHYAPINVKPQGGEGAGAADQGDLTFSREPESNCPHGHRENVKFPLGTAFCPKQVVAMSNSRHQDRTRMSKSPPTEISPSQFPVGSRPPPWGLTLVGALAQ